MSVSNILVMKSSLNFDQSTVLKVLFLLLILTLLGRALYLQVVPSHMKRMMTPRLLMEDPCLTVRRSQNMNLDWMNSQSLPWH